MPESKLVPQNEHWYSDLPLPNGEHSQPSSINGGGSLILNYIDNTYCEISRKGILFRAPMLMVFGISLIMFFVIFLMFIPWHFSHLHSDLGIVLFIFISMGILSLLLAVSSFRLGTQIPIDTPVRFNYARQKVYVYEYDWSINFFKIKRWPTSVKVFDWADIRAEITRTSGYSGTVYMMRQALVCAVCKAGTNEVIDRFTLHGHATTTSLAQIWHYCCVYMAQGRDGVPASRLNDGKVTWNNSLLAVAPFFAFGREGKRIRERMDFLDSVQAIALVIVFPITLILLLGDYISMRVSPKAKWPDDIDLESRTPENISDK